MIEDKYGFGGDDDTPITIPESKKAKKPVDASTVATAKEQGESLGFVDREPSKARKPGPKRKEPQARVTIPGPKRVLDDFRFHCEENGFSLWEGLEDLLARKP